MANSKPEAQAAAAEPTRLRYRNKSKVDQTFFLPTGESVKVGVKGTLLLEPKVAAKYFQFLELVNAEDGTPVPGGTEK